MKLDEKNIAILNFALAYFPYYGTFDLLVCVKSISNDKFKEIYEQLGNPDEQIETIKEFLLQDGHAIKRNDVLPAEKYIELTKRGRWLKETSSLEAYRQSQKEKIKKLRNAEIERTMSIRREKQIKRLTTWIAVSTAVAGLYYILEVLNHIYGFYCH